jgi:hypothetical protein
MLRPFLHPRGSGSSALFESVKRVKRQNARNGRPSNLQNSVLNTILADREERHAARLQKQ